MPKVVDHDERRNDIIAATWRVMAREGLAGTTTREIAREAGYSTGVLAHYFDDRGDILSSALIRAHRGVRTRTDAKIAGQRGLAALRVMMIECSLPVTEQARLEAVIEVCFWGEAVGNQALMRIQNAEVEVFADRIRRLLLQAEADGELDPSVDIDEAIRKLLIFNDGVAIQMVMKPRSADSEKLLALLDEILGALRRRPATKRHRPAARVS